MKILFIFIYLNRIYLICLTDYFLILNVFFTLSQLKFKPFCLQNWNLCFWLLSLSLLIKFTIITIIIIINIIIITVIIIIIIIITLVLFLVLFYLFNFFIYLFFYMHVWIYENGAKEFDPYHPYCTLISLKFYAASKPFKRAKIEKNGNERKLNGWRKEKKHWLSL